MLFWIFDFGFSIFCEARADGYERADAGGRMRAARTIF
jgi:hypothetical protein